MPAPWSGLHQRQSMAAIDCQFSTRPVPSPVPNTSFSLLESCPETDDAISSLHAGAPSRQRKSHPKPDKSALTDQLLQRKVNGRSDDHGSEKPGGFRLAV